MYYNKHASKKIDFTVDFTWRGLLKFAPNIKLFVKNKTLGEMTGALCKTAELRDSSIWRNQNFYENSGFLTFICLKCLKPYCA